MFALRLFDSKKWLVVFASTFVAGCGKTNDAILEGTVTLDGNSLQSGSIVFQPTATSGGGSSVGGQIVEGKFSISTDQRVVPGRFRVEITAVRKTGRQVKGFIGETIDELQELIPKRYNQQSELTADVSARGPNHFEFAIQSK